MEDLTEEITKLSKINSASLINMRINNIWMNVNKYASSGMFLKWNSELDRIWCELVGDVSSTKKKKKGEDKQKSDEEIFDEFNEEISKEFSNLKNKKGFDGYSKDDKSTRLKIYQNIQKKEVFLRRLMNKQGKGTAYQEEADWD